MDAATALLSQIKDELEGWKRRQQISCIGAPENTDLEPLEKWYDRPCDIMDRLARLMAHIDLNSCKITQTLGEHTSSTQKSTRPTRESNPGLLVLLD